MIEIITSPQNKIVKLAGALKEKKFRDEYGLFVVEGIKLVEEAFLSQWYIEYVLVNELVIKKNERVNELLQILKAEHVRLISVPENIYNKISDTEQPQGILAIIKKPVSTLQDIEIIEDKKPLIVVLDGLQDPGNVGTIIRTADAAGVSSVIMVKGCADLYSCKTVRASMGSIFHLPIVAECQASEIISFAKRLHFDIVVTSLGQSSDLYNVNLNRPIAVVFGNEGKGVSQLFMDHADSKVHIPMLGKAESLNVSASAAIILYESMRQKRS